MPGPHFVRYGTWWVEASDGRRIRRLGRDRFLFVDGGVEYEIGAEIGGEAGVGVFPSSIHDPNGQLAEPHVWRRARTLLDISGDPYDPFPDDAVTVQLENRWDDLNPYEGMLRLSSPDLGLLPTTTTYARVMAPAEDFWTKLRTHSQAVVRFELELLEPPGPPGVWCRQVGVNTQVSGSMVTPTRFLTARGFVLPVDTASQDVPLDELISLTGELSVHQLRFIEG